MGVSATDLPSFIQGQPKKLYGGSATGLVNLDFTNFPLDAKVIIFQLANLQVANNNKALGMRFSTDNGVNFDNGGSIYSFAKRFITPGSTGYQTNAGINTMITTVSTLSSGANDKQNFTILVFDPFDVRMTKVLVQNIGINSLPEPVLGFGGMCYENVSIVNGIRIYVSGTTFTDGEYEVYTI